MTIDGIDGGASWDNSPGEPPPGSAFEPSPPPLSRLLLRLPRRRSAAAPILKLDLLWPNASLPMLVRLPPPAAASGGERAALARVVAKREDAQGSAPGSKLRVCLPPGLLPPAAGFSAVSFRAGCGTLVVSARVGEAGRGLAGSATVIACLTSALIKPP